jgi:hypothetical protein
MSCVMWCIASLSSISICISIIYLFHELVIRCQNKKSYHETEEEEDEEEEDEDEVEEEEEEEE